MKTLIEKAKAGSPITKQDLLDGIKWTLNKQPFNTFYNGIFEDYITGVASSEEGKKVIINKVNERLEALFSPIMALLPRLQRPKDLEKAFIAKHYDHGPLEIRKRNFKEYHILYDKCRLHIVL